MNILVIKTKFIGDTVLSSAFFHALKLKHPDSKVTALLSPLTAQVLANNPYIDKVILTSALDGHAQLSKWQRLCASATLLHELRGGKYQRCFVLTRSFYSALMAYLSNIPARIGLAADGRRLLLTTAVDDTRDVHEYEAYLKLVSASEPVLPHNKQHNQRSQHAQHAQPTPHIQAIRPEYFPTALERQAAWGFLLEQFPQTNSEQAVTKIVFLHLSGTNALRRWNNESWVLLAEYLTGKGYCLLWSGAASDVKHMVVITSQLSASARAASCILPVLEGLGLMPIRQLAALISHCAVSICVDTGPMHISAALRVPTIGLFGPGDTVQWHPVGYPSRNAESFKSVINDSKNSLTSSATDNSHYVALISTEPLACRPCHGRAGCTLIQPSSQLPKCMDGLSVDLLIAQLGHWQF